MRAILAVWAFATAASGCASGERMVFADAQLAVATVQAIDAWNVRLRMTCPDVSLASAEGFDAADIEVREDPTVPEGWTVGGHIEIDPSVRATKPDALATLIAHELGHALGADHTEDPGDLMYVGDLPRHRSPEPTTADVHQVCDHFGAGAP